MDIFLLAIQMKQADEKSFQMFRSIRRFRRAGAHYKKQWTSPPSVTTHELPDPRMDVGASDRKATC